MKVLGVDHFTINVVSMEKSNKFYGETLCLKKGKNINMGDHIIQYYYLNTYIMLELIEYKYPAIDHYMVEVDGIGIYRHLAIEVENVEDAYEEIKKNSDIEILQSPSYCEELAFKNFLVKDPNGVELEIIER